jgi:CHAT domain-containing protein
LDEILDSNSRWYSIQASLDCAYANARLSNQPALAALAQLQLARLAHIEATRRPRLQESLFELARSSAANGLLVARQMTDAADRFDLTARLLEMGLAAELDDDALIDQALAELTKHSDESPARAALIHSLHGRNLERLGQDEAAASAFRQAIFLEGQRATPVRLADWYLRLSHVEPDRRAVHVGRAYQALQSLRPLLPFLDPLTEGSTFKLYMEPVFRAAIASLLDQSSQDGSDISIERVQRIVEQYRQAEVQSTFGQNCVPPREPITPADLLAGEVILYPILLDDRVELLFASAGTGGYERLPAIANSDRGRIGLLIREMAFSIGYGDDDTWEKPAAQLYQILIEPIEDRLSSEGTLVIVPDSSLRILPFAALRDKDGSALIERTRIAIAPSLAFTSPGSTLSQNPAILAASLGTRVELAAGVFPALEGTLQEAKVVAAMAGGDGRRGTLLENFASAELEQALASKPVEILHLATHATFNGSSERSFIVARDGAVSLDTLRTLIARNRFRGRDLALLVLSACETAVGDDRASMGLAGAAVQAGAESAVASLWQVNDTGTAELMREFYRNLASRAGRAEALRNAQLALIDRGGPLGDPSLWAAFSVMGAWR